MIHQNQIIKVSEGFNQKNPAIFNTKNSLIFSSLKSYSNSAVHTGVSLKYVLKGQEEYLIDNRRYLVKSGQFLVVNSGQEVGCQIKTDTPTLGGCFYLDEDLIRMYVKAELGNFDLDRLDSFGDTEKLEFRNMIHSHSTSTIEASLKNITQGFLRKSQIEIEGFNTEEFFYKLIAQLTQQHLQENSMVNKLPFTRRATREELFKRVRKSIDYLHEHYEDSPSISQLAKVGCLSDFHYIRVFKHLTQLTPNQYLNDLRFRQSLKLLSNEDISVKEIASKVGFSSASTFGKEFKRRFSQTPLEYRRSN